MMHAMTKSFAEEYLFMQSTILKFRQYTTGRKNMSLQQFAGNKKNNLHKICGDQVDYSGHYDFNFSDNFLKLS